MTSKVLDLFVDGTETDVLLIQPSCLFREGFIEKEVHDYFNAASKIGESVGDSPEEANYGLLSIATNLADNGMAVQILDLNSIDFRLREQGQILSIDLVDAILKKFVARIYGISYMTSTYGMWEEPIYRSIRSRANSANTPIVYGGIHPSVCWRDILRERRDKNLYVMVGEGDIEFPEFCSMLLGRKHKRTDFRGIANCSLQIEKQIVTLEDLRQNCFPNYNLVPPYAKNNVRRFYLTRGCTGGCLFCSVSSFHASRGGKYYRELDRGDRSIFQSHISNIVTEYQKGMKIVMGDLTFFEIDWYFKEFCEELVMETQRRGVKPEWWCQTRADCVTPQMAAILREAGCTQVAIGCESANNRILRALRKNITVDEWKRALYLVKQNDMKAQAYIILGSGFEDGASIENTIETVVSLIDRDLIDLVHLSVLVPYPGTALYNAPEANGIVIVDHDYRNYWMNCDLYGYGMPVYRTISESGKIILESHEIYSYWKLAMGEVSKAYLRKHRRSINIVKENHDVLFTYKGCNGELFGKLYMHRQ